MLHCYYKSHIHMSFVCCISYRKLHIHMTVVCCVVTINYIYIWLPFVALSRKNTAMPAFHLFHVKVPTRLALIALLH